MSSASAFNSLSPSTATSTPSLPPTQIVKGEQYTHTDWAVANSLRAALPFKQAPSQPGPSDSKDVDDARPSQTTQFGTVSQTLSMPRAARMRTGGGPPSSNGVGSYYRPGRRGSYRLLKKRRERAERRQE